MARFTPRVPSSVPVHAVSPERALLLQRAAAALAHEGKNPLNNMVLHLQLLGDRLRDHESGTPIERHLQAVRDGIGRVDALLKAFSDLASPEHLAPDIAAGIARAQLLFASEARRGTVAVMLRGPASVPVHADPSALCDLV